MAEAQSDPKLRFSDRVEDYVRFRPGYPPEVLAQLQQEIGLRSSWVVADVGSGTGLSSSLFLDHGHEVYAVEPNQGMRMAAERLLGRHARFHSIDGSAEETTLPDGSVDLVVAAQAFHWFDLIPTRKEFTRILRPAGWMVLLWNRRLIDATPFLRAYEELLLRYGTDYERVRHENVTPADVAAFYPGPYAYRALKNEQLLTLDALEGRVLSSSYAPGPGHTNHRPMLRALRSVFHEHEQESHVRMEYCVDLYFGQF